MNLARRSLFAAALLGLFSLGQSSVQGGLVRPVSFKGLDVRPVRLSGGTGSIQDVLSRFHAGADANSVGSNDYCENFEGRFLFGHHFGDFGPIGQDFRVYGRRQHDLARDDAVDEDSGIVGLYDRSFGLFDSTGSDFGEFASGHGGGQGGGDQLASLGAYSQGMGLFGPVGSGFLHYSTGGKSGDGGDGSFGAFGDYYALGSDLGLYGLGGDWWSWLGLFGGGGFGDLFGGLFDHLFGHEHQYNDDHGAFGLLGFLFGPHSLLAHLLDLLGFDILNHHHGPDPHVIPSPAGLVLLLTSLPCFAFSYVVRRLSVLRRARRQALLPQ